MSPTVFEYIAFFAFIFLFIAVVLGEMFWLKAKGWATMGRVSAFVLITDLISFCVGSLVVFVMALLLLMMVMGPSGRGSNAGDTSYVIVLILAAIIPPIVLTLTKRIFLKVFGLRSGKSAWVYSVVVSIVIFMVTLIPPPVIFYLSSKFV